MAADEPPRPAPVVLRIKLRYEDVDTLVERFAPNVGKSGLFLPTRSLRPVGTEVRFELKLANDTPALVGLGKVRAVREPDPANPKAAFGMAIELLRVTRESRELILRMLERRRALGLGDTSLPIPDDAAASQRADVESTGVRDLGMTPPTGTPTPTPAPTPVVAEPVFTAPRSRRSSIGIAVTRDASPFAISPLPAEPARARRPRLSEVMAAGRSAGRDASARQADPLDDENVDVARALTRARVLAGSDLDGELAALRDQAAAPIEISIEAASAELARQLGGLAVKRDRSARWSPPPDIKTDPAIVSEAVSDPVSDSDSVSDPAAVSDSVSDPAAVSDSDSVSDPVSVSDPGSGPDPASAITASPVNAPAWPSSSAETADAHEVTRLVDLSVAAPSEVTRIFEIPTAPPPPSATAEPAREITITAVEPPDHRRRAAPIAIATVVTTAAALEAARPRTPTPSPSGLMIDDSIDPDEFSASVATPPPSASPLHAVAAIVPDDDDDAGEHTQFTQLEVAPFVDRRDLITHPTIDPDAPDPAADHVPAAEDDDEIDDFEIIAEADADDADLLLADGEGDASSGHGMRAAQVDGQGSPPTGSAVAPRRGAVDEPLPSLPVSLAAAAPAHAPPSRPSTFDFASRLDLGEDDELPPDEISFPRPRHAVDQAALPDDDDDHGHHEAELDAGDLGGGLGGPRSRLLGDDVGGFDDPVSFVGADPVAPAAAPDPARPRYDNFDPGPARPRYDDSEGDFGALYTDAGDAGPGEPPTGYAPPVRFDSEHAGFAEPLLDSVDGRGLSPTSSAAEWGGGSIDAALAEEASVARHSEPYVLNAPASGVARGDDDYDLESALDSLDVDLDDLSIPAAPDDAVTPPRGRANTGRPGTARPGTVRPGSPRPPTRTGTGAQRTIPAAPPTPARPGRPARLPRATSDDGVMINFDDDDDTSDK